MALKIPVLLHVNVCFFTIAKKWNKFSCLSTTDLGKFIHVQIYINKHICIYTNFHYSYVSIHIYMHINTLQF